MAAAVTIDMLGGGKYSTRCALWVMRWVFWVERMRSSVLALSEPASHSGASVVLLSPLHLV